jgi:hypothetical protein
VLWRLWACVARVSCPTGSTSESSPVTPRPLLHSFCICAGLCIPRLGCGLRMFLCLLPIVLCVSALLYSSAWPSPKIVCLFPKTHRFVVEPQYPFPVVNFRSSSNFSSAGHKVLPSHHMSETDVCSVLHIDFLSPQHEILQVSISICPFQSSSRPLTNFRCVGAWINNRIALRFLTHCSHKSLSRLTDSSRLVFRGNCIG